MLNNNEELDRLIGNDTLPSSQERQNNLRLVIVATIILVASLALFTVFATMTRSALSGPQVWWQLSAQAAEQAAPPR